MEKRKKVAFQEHYSVDRRLPLMGTPGGGYGSSSGDGGGCYCGSSSGPSGTSVLGRGGLESGHGQSPSCVDPEVKRSQ